MSEPGRPVSSDPPDGERLLIRCRGSRRHHLDRVPPPVEKAAERLPVTRRAAGVRRPDPRHDHDLHGAVPPARRVGSAPMLTRKRARATAHAAANTTVDTRTATAAPVTPQRAPSTATSGMTTIVSK